MEAQRHPTEERVVETLIERTNIEPAGTTANRLDTGNSTGNHLTNGDHVTN